MPDHAKEYSLNVIEFTIRANESCFEEFECRKTLIKVLNVHNYADILVEGAFRAIECRRTYFRVIVGLLVQRIAYFL